MIKINKVAILFSFILFVLSACNSGGSNSVVTPAPAPDPFPTPSNPFVAISVSPNYENNNPVCSNQNTPCVSVTVCAPGSPNLCQTVDNILIDSGSVGLRIFSSAFTNTSFVNGLPIESYSGQQIAECITYGDNSANWGPIALAYISLNGESTTQSIPMQLIESTYVNPSSYCPGAEAYPTPTSFGINGILGVGPYINDNAVGGGLSYFSCSSNSCSYIQNPQKPVVNPIAFFPNGLESGITIKFQSVNDNGSSGIKGYAIFGVGSNINNTPGGNVNIYTIYPNYQNCQAGIGCIPTTLSNTNINAGFLDTGSTYLYFLDNSISHGTNNYYNPSSTVTLYPSNTSNNNSSIQTSFNIANADTLFNNYYFNSTFNNIGYYLQSITQYDLDYGLPFFFGKTVYICFYGKTCSGRAGPYWAF